MKWTKLEQKQFTIFASVTFGFTYLMGILLWCAYAKGQDTSLFPLAQMLYPAAGVIIAYFAACTKNETLPKKFYTVYLLITTLMIFCTICSVISGNDNWIHIGNIIVYIGSIGGFFFLFRCDYETRKTYGLISKSSSKSLFCVCLFIILLLLRTIISYGLSGQWNNVASLLTSPKLWISSFMLLPSFFLSFLFFFGEEYGWRYFLQPLLQKRFGRRIGVIILGSLWGIWHLPLDFFYYTTPEYGFMGVLAHQITCITLGIFFAYAYMKTENIWVPTILHFLFNNWGGILSLISNEGILQEEVIQWQDLLYALILNIVLFAGFLLAKEFSKSSQQN